MQVIDSGVGISKEDQSNLFKLFGFLQSTKELNSKGIGLGLHISKKITKMFEGDIICRSKQGKGSNFVFLVALGSRETVDDDCLKTNNRILNPFQKIYGKIHLKNNKPDMHQTIECQQIEDSEIDFNE